MRFGYISILISIIFFTSESIFAGSLTSKKNLIKVEEVRSPQSNKIRSNIHFKSYFKKETTFFGENASNRLRATYFSDGRCRLEGYILEEGDWLRVTSEGYYYIKNNILYVTWDEWVKESYRLDNKQYKCDGLIFKQK